MGDLANRLIRLAAKAGAPRLGIYISGVLTRPTWARRPHPPLPRRETQGSTTGRLTPASKHAPYRSSVNFSDAVARVRGP